MTSSFGEISLVSASKLSAASVTAIFQEQQPVPQQAVEEGLLALIKALMNLPSMALLRVQHSAYKNPSRFWRLLGKRRKEKAELTGLEPGILPRES